MREEILERALTPNAIQRRIEERLGGDAAQDVRAAFDEVLSRSPELRGEVLERARVTGAR